MTNLNIDCQIQIVKNSIKSIDEELEVLYLNDILHFLHNPKIPNYDLTFDIHKNENDKILKSLIRFKKTI